MKNLIGTTIFLLAIFGMVMVSGELDSNPTGECIQLRTILNSTAVNLSSIEYPNGTVIFLNEEMTKNGQTFNYSFCNTNDDGIYTYDYWDVDNEVGYVNQFEINPAGFKLNPGNSVVIFGSLLIMIILSGTFLYLATKSENIVAKVSLYSFAFIVFFMSFLYTVVTIQQTLFGFDSIVNGVETFLFVLKIGMWVGFVALGVVIFLIMLKAWQIKRGLRD